MRLALVLFFISLVVSEILFTFANRKQCFGLPLAVRREESPGNTGHPASENGSCR